ncbi:hypothetical protein [Catalinimonas niigatensis]|uniref:hypothetical protein n=1 Tax=Catalinimonas niigatensis TaxID=1397264 RepID=UPI0026668752|nr:hypothetical protein [Catalinimonas niigatensis]WPP50312.1 hypothetical protein PZB72_26965 [Catalinimonas niigatensis]
MKNLLKILSFAFLFTITCAACTEEDVLKDVTSNPTDIDQDGSNQKSTAGINSPANPDRLYEYEE